MTPNTATNDESRTHSRNFPTLSNEQVATLAVALAAEKKAFRPVIIDLRNQGAFTEYFVVLSAANARQAAALADTIKTIFKHEAGIAPISVDGLETGTWILMDYGFLFVHIFQEPTREVYQLEKLWSKGRFLDTSDEALAAARALLPK